MKVTDQGIPVDTLISVVKDSIKQAGVSDTSRARDLKVASVHLILEVVASKGAGGGLTLCVPFIGMKLSIGGKVTKKDTHTIDITLVPPAERAARQVRGGEVQDILVDAITTIRDVMRSAAGGTIPGSFRRARSTFPSPSRRPGPSPLESTVSWPTSSPIPCASASPRNRGEPGVSQTK
jgi:Trypsin-co-occurring domain 2